MNFSNCSRNKFLAKQGLGQPQPMSTGTTICGVIFDGGLVLGADTRATAGEWIFLNVRILCFIYFYQF
jgi:20S proteasome subunit beta 2